MQNLSDVVRETVEDFVKNSTLFTALDVSNKVKSVIPHARHREVRDLVRNMFTSYVEPMGWARSPITVTLADGDTAEALLYHPLSDSWDLDTKYDDQKRNQTSVRANVAPAQTVVPAPVSVIPPAPVSVAPPTPQVKDLWDQMFGNQPSLFPLK